MPVVAANGIEINYTDSGGDGPVVVFSHGFLMDLTMFDQQVTALAPEYRVITWDERGHGGTWATGPFTYWDSAADVLALLDQLGVERAVLAGMSQGGFLSLRAALTATDRGRCRRWSPRSSWARASGMTGTPSGTSSTPSGRRTIWGSLAGRSGA